ncbi:MAG: hypothetical protein Kow0059_16390 [Candidatus Sumerlaeia bacterium]
MKWLFALVVLAVIAYVVYIRQTAPRTPAEQRAAAMRTPAGVAQYFCEAAMRGSAADMDAVSTEKGAGRGAEVIRALRAEEQAMRTSAVKAVVLVGGGALSDVRDVKAILQDAAGAHVLVISAIRTEKQPDGSWRITYVSVD